MPDAFQIIIGDLAGFDRNHDTFISGRTLTCASVRELLFHFPPNMWLALRIISMFPGVSIEEIARDLRITMREATIEVMTLLSYGLCLRSLDGGLYIKDDSQTKDLADNKFRG